MTYECIGLMDVCLFFPLYMRSLSGTVKVHRFLTSEVVSGSKQHLFGILRCRNSHYQQFKIIVINKFMAKITHTDTLYKYFNNIKLGII